MRLVGQVVRVSELRGGNAPLQFSKIYGMLGFEHFFQPTILEAEIDAFLHSHLDVIANRPRVSTGADRMDLALFLRDRAKHVAAISRKVLDGRYTFAPFLEREIPKPGSKKPRTISICSIRDCIVQRAVYKYAYQTIDQCLAPVVFGYRKKMKAHDAVRMICGRFQQGLTCVFDADISGFFDNVNHEILMEMVRRLGLDQRAQKIILRFVKTGRVLSTEVDLHKSKSGKQRKYATVPRQKGVAQGGILSGILTNLYLADFDKAILSRHCGLVRYADDFLVCCGTWEECADVRFLVESELGKLKLDLKTDKTIDCLLAATGVPFLGFQIATSRIRVRNRNIAKFKDRISTVIRMHKNHKSGTGTLKSLCRKLRYKIRGPDEEQLAKASESGPVYVRCRRSWIGYFRIVNDLAQIRALDRWLRTQVSAFAWRRLSTRISLKTMQKIGLPSLVNCLWKARKAKKAANQYDSET